MSEHRTLPLSSLYLSMGSCTSKPGILQNAVPSPAPTQPSTRSRQLPADVVLMILKLAQGTVLLSDLRVVSRMFDDLIVPIIYSDVTLNPRILACFQESTSQRSAAQGQVVKDICTHTRHVLITKELRWPLVLQLLYSLENLRELRYVMMLCPEYLYLKASLEIEDRGSTCQADTRIIC